MKYIKTVKISITIHNLDLMMSDLFSFIVIADKPKTIFCKIRAISRYQRPGQFSSCVTMLDNLLARIT